MALALTIVTEGMSVTQRVEWMAEFDDKKQAEDRRAFAGAWAAEGGGDDGR